MSAQSKNPTNADGRSGFTLFETLVVLVILGLAMSISAYTVWGRSARTDPDLLAGHIRQFLHSAHLKALITGNTTSVIFDLESRLISGDFDAATIEIPENIEIALTVGRELVESERAAPVRFFGQGGSSGLRVELSGDGGRRSVVATNWLTGATRIAEEQP